ncbi:MAG TPA: HAD hydrolase family protein [Acidobacteriota bacterium]|nr:HAD hydrolase family protein [Acidobacteriota bacterium]
MTTADLREIKLLVLDVDGVLTDGRIGLTPEGEEVKFFSTKDGYGIRMAITAGIEVAFLTGRESGAVSRRAAELGVRHVMQGAADKLSLFLGLLQELGLEPDQAAAMGDDVLDLPVLNHAGFSAAPADAVEEVRSQVDWVSSNPGGFGAVRELIDYILSHR